MLITYIRIIRTDLKANLVLFILILIYSIISVFILCKVRLADVYFREMLIYFFPLILLLAIFEFYLCGYFRYRAQQKIKQLIEMENGVCFMKMNAEVFFKPLQINVYMQGRDISLSLKSRMDEVDVFECDDFIVILGYSYEYGKYRRHLNPLVIRKSGDKEFPYSKVFNPKMVEYSKTDSVITLTFFKFYQGISRIVIFQDGQ